MSPAFSMLPADPLGADTSGVASTADIVDTIAAATVLKTLTNALRAAGMVDTLRGPGPFTVFAPNDEAFARIPRESLNLLLKDRQKLADILRCHVIPGALMASDVKPGPMPTLQGRPLSVKLEDGRLWVDDAKVVKIDVDASNGIIHVIDAVIQPTPAP